MKDIRLYNYQTEMKERIDVAFRSYRSVMVQMPTGTGKTVLLSEVVKGEEQRVKNPWVWIVVHRRELVEQIRDTLDTMLSCPYSTLDTTSPLLSENSRIKVMSIQWLSRHYQDMAEKPSLIVIDEAHHAVAKTYAEVMNAYPEARKLGVTATPCRLNKKGFTDLFDVLLQSWPTKKFIADGRLSLYDYMSIKADSIDQRMVFGLTKRGADGDFSLKEMSEKLRVGILGGTGMVGQRFISLLENHPWFEVVTIAASARSAGKTYEEAVGGRWKMDTPMPEAVKKIIVMNVNEVEKVAASVDFVFSAVDMSKDEIKAIEEAYAKTETPVVSNNSAHRWTPDVPMVVPEINPEHFEVIEHQKKRLGTTRGFIAVKPNCSIQSYAPVLTAWKEFEPYEVVATTYQAISGAGKTFKDWPEMVGNIIPYIGGEEEKSEQEPLRIWGHIEDGVIVKAEEPKITCQCIRVPVLNGHTAAVFVKFRKKPTKEQLIDRLVNFKGFPQEAGLPSAPKQFIRYMEEDNRPQVQLDVNYENGMGISVGRIREDSIYDWKFVGLSHNTVRGAAGGAVLCAETLKAKGYIAKK